MTRYLTLEEVLDLHAKIIQKSGGMPGVRDANALDSAVVQPMMAFGGQELYSVLHEKAAALGFSLIMNHPFFDGNKRIGHAAMEAFLVLNAHELSSPTDEQEQVILQLAAGLLSRPDFTEWVRLHVIPRQTP